MVIVPSDISRCYYLTRCLDVCARYDLSGIYNSALYWGKSRSIRKPEEQRCAGTLYRWECGSGSSELDFQKIRPGGVGEFKNAICRSRCN